MVLVAPFKNEYMYSPNSLIDGFFALSFLEIQPVTTPSPKLVDTCEANQDRLKMLSWMLLLLWPWNMHVSRTLKNRGYEWSRSPKTVVSLLFFAQSQLGPSNLHMNYPILASSIGFECTIVQFPLSNEPLKITSGQLKKVLKKGSNRLCHTSIHYGWAVIVIHYSWKPLFQVPCKAKTEWGKQNQLQSKRTPILPLKLTSDHTVFARVCPVHDLLVFARIGVYPLCDCL